MSVEGGKGHVLDAGGKGGVAAQAPCPEGPAWSWQPWPGPLSLWLWRKKGVWHRSRSPAAITPSSDAPPPSHCGPTSHLYSATPHCCYQTTLIVLHLQHSPCCCDSQIPPSLPHRSQDWNPSSWGRSQPKPSSLLFPGLQVLHAHSPLCTGT